VGDVPPVRGSAARLGQVFLNLVVNAAHAIPHGNPDAHTIHLAARTEPAGRVAITVSDTGAGIPPENLARIFEPFFTTKPVGLGTGLGLWICQSIVAAFGGTIEVASELGRGTTFRVVLVAAGRAMGADGAPDRRDRRARRRLLVVDDEPLVAATVRRQLAAEFAVDAASGVGDALARIASGRYDAVVCDADMPGPGGLQLLDALRRDAPELARRLLFITGGEAANPVGAPSLAKPFDGRQLRRALRALLPSA
jgi:CheY-like chemotaxis protein